MLEVLETTRIAAAQIAANGDARQKRRVPDDIVFPEHDEDMGETSFHSSLINDLLQALTFFFRDRADVFTATNLNVYFDEEQPQRWCAPDIFVAFGVSNEDRRSFKVWEERRFPQVVFEVASERTWKNDVADKYLTYDVLGAEEYYLLDPEQEYLPAPLIAYQRRDNRLRPVRIGNNRVFSPLMNLEIVQTDKSFRLFDLQKQTFLMTLAEYEQRVERLSQTEAENRKLLAEIERLKAQQQ